MLNASIKTSSLMLLLHSQTYTHKQKHTVARYSFDSNTHY